jgi:hypothetical protein
MPCTDCPADVETQHGALACENCAPPGHVRCPGCGEWHPEGSDCAGCLTCSRCHTPVPEDETVETLRGSTICTACRCEWYWQCDGCDGWNRDGHDCTNGCCDPDNCSCDDCRGYDLAGFAGLVHEYSYKPRPVFHGTGPLYLGPEIEIETPAYNELKCARIAHTHLGGLGYLKLDNSIGNGFEIVTHPMSYQWAIDNFPWLMLTELHESGCAATASTGIHVHVSRAGFTSTGHTYRWMKFVYRNERQVKTVARRSCNTWAAFTAQDRRAVKDYAKGAHSDRYRAINTSTPATYELRIFASSLDPGEVQAALGFAAASVEYTRNLTISNIRNGGWGWPAFVAWLGGQPAYQPLTGQLEALQCVC